MILRSSCLALFCTLFLGNAAQAADFNIRVNPLSILNDTFSGELLYSPAESYALGGGLQYLNSSSGDTTVKGAGLMLRANWYFTAFAEDSWYVGPLVQFVSVRGETENGLLGSAEATASVVGIGGMGGYQWIWGSGFNIALGLGLQNYSSSKLKVKYSNGYEENVSIPLNGTKLAGEFALGFAF